MQGTQRSAAMGLLTIDTGPMVNQSKYPPWSSYRYPYLVRSMARTDSSITATTILQLTWCQQHCHRTIPNRLASLSWRRHATGMGCIATGILWIAPTQEYRETMGDNTYQKALGNLMEYVGTTQRRAQKPGIISVTLRACSARHSYYTQIWRSINTCHQGRTMVPSPNRSHLHQNYRI